MSRPADPVTGVKCFTIGGRMVERRQRCLGMTDEERRWRAQWLKDQVLSPDEPRYVPEYYKAKTNFIQRLWKTPMNKLEQALEPTLGAKGAYNARFILGHSFLWIVAIYTGVYYVKYHANNFETCKSLEFANLRNRMYPHDPDYPNVPVKKPSDYYDMGFYSSVLCQEVQREPPPPPPPPPEAPAPLLDEQGEEIVIVCNPSEVVAETE